MSACGSDGNVALEEVSIEIGAGEIVGLIGTNGAGKSTLMNAIGGYVSSTGTVELLGDNVSSLSPSARAKRGLGRTFQSATLFPELTVRETVEVALERRGRCDRERERAGAAADDLIDFLGLGRYADAYISDLSTGTRRVVELAGLLALDARVLCLDEPTAGLAQRETEAFGPVINDIRRELRRVGRRDRARHAADHEHQQPRVLPRAREGHLRRGARRGSQRPGCRRRLPRHRRTRHRPQRRDDE